MEASAAAGAGGGEPEPEASAPEPEVSGRRSSVIDMSQWMSADGQLPVSYTHLTLPTKA